MRYYLLGCFMICIWVIQPESNRYRKEIASTREELPNIYYVYLNDFESYRDSIAPRVSKVRYKLEWLQAVTVEATYQQRLSLLLEPYIDSVVKMQTSAPPILTETPEYAIGLNPKWDTLLSQQRRLMELGLLEEEQLTGKGVRIAILDAGFKFTDQHPAFEHLFDHNQIIATRDFYQNDEGVYHHSQHGTQVLGCLAGKYGDQWIGVAHDAEFLLARTEHSWWEKAREEDHWIAALEWAHQQGAQIICSSLSFTDNQDAFPQMDGKTHPISIAAAKASEKGMLIIVSMGNEGNRKRRFMGSPADASSVVSVGGSMPMIPMHIPFSSTGPNALNEVKPNVAAPAYVLTIKGRNTYGIKAGTSFACPIIAGLAACLIQRDPSLKNSDIRNIIEKSGHYYPYYDYYLGFGVPQISRLLEKNLPPSDTTFWVTTRGDTMVLTFKPSIDRDTASPSPNGKVLYYHLESPDGYLEWAFYDLIPLDAKKYGFIPPSAKGILRVWFDQFLYEQELE